VVLTARMNLASRYGVHIVLYVDFVLLWTEWAIYFAFPFLSGTFQELS
jgi:hypothetical protein